MNEKKKKALNEVMNMEYNPREIARKQYNTYKEYVVNHLKEIADAIDEGNYEDVLNEDTFRSPAGDGYGMDNTVINFSFDNKPVDIEKALNRLSFLSAYADGYLDIDEKYNEHRDYINDDFD